MSYRNKKRLKASALQPDFVKGRHRVSLPGNDNAYTLSDELSLIIYQKTYAKN